MLRPDDDEGYLNVGLELQDDGTIVKRIRLDNRLKLDGKWEMALVEFYYELSNRRYIPPSQNANNTEYVDQMVQAYSIYIEFGPARKDTIAQRMGFESYMHDGALRDTKIKEYNEVVKRDNSHNEVVKHEFPPSASRMVKYEFMEDFFKLGKGVTLTADDLVRNFNEKFSQFDSELYKINTDLQFSWQGYPKLVFVNGKIEMKIPGFVRRIDMGYEIARMLGFSNILDESETNKNMALFFKRTMIKIPSPFLGYGWTDDGEVDLQFERFHMLTDCTSIRALQNTNGMRFNQWEEHPYILRSVGLQISGNCKYTIVALHVIVNQEKSITLRTIRPLAILSIIAKRDRSFNLQHRQ